MENNAESNLSMLEEQTSDELSFEELESVAGGGWIDDVGDAIGKGARAVGKGIADLSQIPGKAGRAFGGGFREGQRDG